MNNEEKKMIVKQSLKEILIYYGAQPGKLNWQCVPGQHKTPNFDLSVRGNICCCHCSLQGDSLSVISILENLNLKKDFSKIINKGLEILGDKNKFYTGNSSIKKIEYKKEQKKYNTIEVTNIISQNFKKAKRNEYSYFYNRKITNVNLFRKYKFLIGNPTKIFEKELIPNISNIWAYEYIIPVWSNGKVVNCILRRNDKKSILNKKILNLKGLELKIFNIDYLNEKNNCLFITEGVFDALTFENYGFKAIALNSVVMVNKFLKEVHINIPKLSKTVFIIAFDNDEAGEKAKAKVMEGLKNFGLICYGLKIQKYKDINEYCIKATKAFVASLKYLHENIINNHNK